MDDSADVAASPDPAAPPLVPGVPGAGGFSFIPWLISRRMSADAWRNFLNDLPTVLPISGSFLGPKMISAKVKIRISSIGPMLNMGPLLYGEI